MSNFAQQWLTRRASPQGMLACGLCDPNGKSICHSLDELCSASKMGKILAQFEFIRPALFADDPGPRWSTWVFQQAQIRFVKRADGWLFALVVRAESEAIAKLDALSEEFLALEL
jgi:hypothetical protein